MFDRQGRAAGSPPAAPTGACSGCRKTATGASPFVGWACCGQPG